MAIKAEIIAFDSAEEMIAHACNRTTEHVGRIRYHVVDATDEVALLALGQRQSDVYS
jgi:hypothetical protein